MKMKTSHFNRLQGAILSMLDNYPKAHETYQRQGLSDMRYRWDLLWASGVMNDREFNKSLAVYLNDNHIDTALKAITRTR